MGALMGDAENCADVTNRDVSGRESAGEFSSFARGSLLNLGSVCAILADGIHAAAHIVYVADWFELKSYRDVLDRYVLRDGNVLACHLGCLAKSACLSEAVDRGNADHPPLAFANHGRFVRDHLLSSSRAFCRLRYTPGLIVLCPSGRVNVAPFGLSQTV